ncbi:MAG: polysaccharide deacetylase family protein [Gemmatimonadales bacterium]
MPRESWSNQVSRVVANTETLLSLLAEHDALGTFFVLGWVADRHPDLVRRIASLGHEVASHSWWHQRVHTLDQAAFREEARRSKGTLEDLVGEPVIGFRAPSFSIVPGFEWAFDVLAAEGYRYDSSVFPIRRPGYGYPGAPLGHHRLTTGSGPLIELPMATYRLGPVVLPAAGGGYLRQLPAAPIPSHPPPGRSTSRAGHVLHPSVGDRRRPAARIRVGPLTRHGTIAESRERTLPRLRKLCAGSVPRCEHGSDAQAT